MSHNSVTTSCSQLLLLICFQAGPMLSSTIITDTTGKNYLIQTIIIDTTGKSYFIQTIITDTTGKSYFIQLYGKVLTKCWPFHPGAKLVNSLWHINAMRWHRFGQTLAQVNSLLPNGTKPFPEPMLTYHQWVLYHSYESNFPWNTHINLLKWAWKLHFSDNCHIPQRAMS